MSPIQPTQDQQKTAGFFAELVTRFFAKTPKFYKIVQAIGGIAGALAMAPDVLTMLSVNVPASMHNIVVRITAAVGFTIALTAQLGASDKDVTTTQSSTSTDDTGK